VFCGMRLPWRTVPASLRIRLVPVRIAPVEFLKLLLGLTIFPAGTVLPDHKIIWRVESPDAPPPISLMIQLEGRGLVVILEASRVVLEFVDGSQFHTKAFKLDCDATFRLG